MYRGVLLPRHLRWAWVWEAIQAGRPILNRTGYAVWRCVGSIWARWGIWKAVRWSSHIFKLVPCCGMHWLIGLMLLLDYSISSRQLQRNYSSSRCVAMTFFIFFSVIVCWNVRYFPLRLVLGFLRSDGCVPLPFHFWSRSQCVAFEFDILFPCCDFVFLPSLLGSSDTFLLDILLSLYLFFCSCGLISIIPIRLLLIAVGAQLRGFRSIITLAIFDFPCSRIRFYICPACWHCPICCLFPPLFSVSVFCQW